MKIAKLLLLSITAIALSCDEEDVALPTAEGMVGTWAMTGLEYGGSTTTTVSGVTAKADFIGTGKNMEVNTTFNEDPNTVSSEGTYTIELKTTSMGQTTTTEYDFDQPLPDGTWTLVGRTLTVTSSGQAQEATITEQTDTLLKIKVVTEQKQTASGYTVTTSIVAVYTFEKN